MRKKITFLLVVLLGVHIFLLANLQFTAWPEMLSYPYLRNHGFLLYKDMIHPYPPVLTMGLSIIYSIFGYKLWVMEAAAWLMILASDILIYSIVRRLTKSEKPAILSLAFFILIQPFLEGNMLWFDLAIVPPILLGTLFLLENKTKRNLVIAGLAFGTAALTKQTAALFLIVASGLLLARKVKTPAKLRDLVRFLAGPAILAGVLIVRLLTENAFLDFLKWTLVYPASQWSKFPGYVQMSLTNREIVVLLMLLIPVVFLLAKLKTRLAKDKNLLLLFLFLLASFILVYPRFSFFHFQAALAFVAIIFGYLVKNLKIQPRLLAAYSILLFLVIALPMVKKDWGQEARFYSSDDIRIAGIIREKVAKDKKVFLLGIHSGLYVMADRIPPKRWTDNFGWYLEIPQVQDEIIKRWTDDPPAAVFWREPEEGNWFDLGTYQPEKITKWIEENYTKEERVSPEVWLWQEKKI